MTYDAIVHAERDAGGGTRDLLDARIGGEAGVARRRRRWWRRTLIELLPAGAVVPALTAHNVHDRAAALATLRSVLEGIGRPRRIGLITSDAIAKISVVRFEKVPARLQDLDQLVRWQVRKTAPFAIEDAQVSFVPGRTIDRGPGIRRLDCPARRD